MHVSTFHRRTQQLKAPGHNAISSTVCCWNCNSTPSLMLIMPWMKSHHIEYSTIFSILHNMTSSWTRWASGKKLKVIFKSCTLNMKQEPWLVWVTAPDLVWGEGANQDVHRIFALLVVVGAALGGSSTPWAHPHLPTVLLLDSCSRGIGSPRRRGAVQLPLLTLELMGEVS